MKLKAILATSLGLIYCAGAYAEPVFLNSSKAVENPLPFSEAVEAGGALYLSGQVGLVPGTQKLAAGGISGESRQTMENIKATLNRFGYGMNHVAKCTVFLVDLKDWADFNTVYKEYFDAGKFPARSAVGVSALALNSKVEVECVASK